MYRFLIAVVVFVLSLGAIAPSTMAQGINRELLDASPQELAQYLIDNPIQPGDLPFGFVPDNPEHVTWGLEMVGFPQSIGEEALIAIEAAPNNLLFWAIFDSPEDAEYGSALLQSALERASYEESPSGFLSDPAVLLEGYIRTSSGSGFVAVCAVGGGKFLTVSISITADDPDQAMVNAIDLTAGGLGYLNRLFTNTPAPEPVLPGSLVYEAADADAFGQWQWYSPDDWSVSADGTLLSSSAEVSENVPYPAYAPIDQDGYPVGSDGLPSAFVIEAELRVLSTSCSRDLWDKTSFRFVANTGGASHLIEFRYPPSDYRCLKAELFIDGQGFYDGGKFIPFALDETWRTYRIEVQKTQIHVFIDGERIGTLSDARHLPPGGMVGIATNGVQIEVRSFRVTAL